MKERDKVMDTVMGIMIIHMILGHCIQRTGAQVIWLTNAMEYLYFFMPWFFFKSGMYYYDKNLTRTLAGGGKRLLLPFVVYSIVGHLVHCLQLWQDGVLYWKLYVVQPLLEIATEGACTGNSPLWFLLTLYVVRVIAFWGIKSRRNSLIVIVISLVGFVTLHYAGFTKPLYITNILSGVFFFMCGNQMKECQYDNRVAIVSLIGYVVICITCLTAVDMRSMQLLRGHFLLYPISCLCGIISINNIFKRSGLTIDFLRWIGKNSMIFYVWHWIVISVIKIVIPLIEADYTNEINLMIVLLICAITLPLLVKSKEMMNGFHLVNNK